MALLPCEGTYDGYEESVQEEEINYVVHCKKEQYDVYVGRGSKWGNPFIIGIHGDREKVIEKYREWLLQSDLSNELYELKGKILGCWCAPKECHGDVLAELANL